MFNLIKSLNKDQKNALEILSSKGNVFLTGVAGSGKSHLVNHFLNALNEGGVNRSDMPVLASTGAAAILVGGRTFHSFFGLGIFEKGIEATITRAVKNPKVKSRLKRVKGIVIDEISMISGPTLAAAEAIAKIVRLSDEPWGGLKVVAVGDFCQLPPVEKHDKSRKWAFLDKVWDYSNFQPAILRECVRAHDEDFLRIMNKVRIGQIDSEVKSFFDSRKIQVADDFPATRLFSRRDEAEGFNIKMLANIKGEEQTFETAFRLKETDETENLDDEEKQKRIDRYKTQFPVPELVRLKENALVMIRQNDIEGDYVNGSVGYVREIDSDTLTIELMNSDVVHLEKTKFSMLDANGEEIAYASNFPVNLAYATTIHKAQGMTLDKCVTDFKRLWEAGHAYVALSRVKKADDIFIRDWSPYSIKTDPEVKAFYDKIF